MRRIQKILLGIFLGGVLLGGIGTGVAVVEYSSLKYEGRKVIGMENLKTEDLDFDLDADGKPLLLNGGYYGRHGRDAEVQEDATVPVGTIRYQVTYNQNVVKPYLHYERYDEEDGENAGELWLNMDYQEDDLEIFFENKDRFLEDLKQGIISSYEVAYVTDVKIKVNPKTKNYEYCN